MRRNQVPSLQADMTEIAEQRNRSEAVPGWVDKLCIGLVVYALACAVWLLAGLGSEGVRHYVGLLADSPACLIAVLITVTAARRQLPGAVCTAWRFLSLALGLYLVATLICVYSWLHGRDPFPGVADYFYLGFYPELFFAALFLIRAAAVRFLCAQLALDATILVIGFGAFFWFLVIRPAASATHTDVVKDALSQTYLALNCIMLLTLGVLLVAGRRRSRRRVPLLLLGGVALMSLGGILLSVGQVLGDYLSRHFH